MSNASSWSDDGAALRRELTFDDFVSAFAFVTRVALVAQRLDHHPDITISWNRVTVASTSHDAGGTVTDRDRRLTAAIDALL